MVDLRDMEDFRARKRRGERISVLTAYDYPTARLLDESGIDMILVGDSLGMVVLGYRDTTEVKFEEMLHHTRAVSRGVKRALLVGDLSIGTYDTPAAAVANAQRLAEAGIVVEEDHPDLSEAHQRQVLRAYDSAIGKAHLLIEIARTSSSGRLER